MLAELTPDQTALLAAFVASILTSMGALGVAAYRANKDAQQREKDRAAANVEARLADERYLREQKRERVYPIYVDVVVASRTIRTAAKRLRVLLGDETKEERDAKVNESLVKATADLDRPMVLLSLEPGAGPLVDAYEQLRAAFLWYVSWLLPRQEAGQGKAGEMGEALQKIEGAADAILAHAREHVERLTTPL